MLNDEICSAHSASLPFGTTTRILGGSPLFSITILSFLAYTVQGVQKKTATFQDAGI